MKANEAPEKIYIHKSQYWGLMANEHNITKNGVEYIRTDAFIEKAIGRLKHYLDNGVWIANDVGYREKEAIVEDFKMYLEE